MAIPFLRDSLKTYTRFVHASKFTLSALIVLVLVFMVVVPLIINQKSGARVAFSSISEKEDTPPIMVNPRYEGMDGQNRAYVVKAATALQTSDSTVTLEKVEADLTPPDGKWLALLADQGLLNMNEQSLLLQGDVMLYSDGGTEMTTEQVRLNLDNLTAVGESPVQIQGNFGHIRSNRFQILDKGNRMLFNGNVYVLLSP